MDVIIIGGGPVGLHAARSLASSGFEIEVLEEHSTAGEPVHCTGILSPAIFKEFNLLPAGTLNELRRVQFHSPKGQVIRYQTNQVEAVVVAEYWPAPAEPKSMKVYLPKELRILTAVSLCTAPMGDGTRPGRVFWPLGHPMHSIEIWEWGSRLFFSIAHKPSFLRSISGKWRFTWEVRWLRRVLPGLFR